MLRAKTSDNGQPLCLTTRHGKDKADPGHCSWCNP